MFYTTLDRIYTHSYTRIQARLKHGMNVAKLDRTESSIIYKICAVHIERLTEKKVHRVWMGEGKRHTNTHAHAHSARAREKQMNRASTRAKKENSKFFYHPRKHTKKRISFISWLTHGSPDSCGVS